MKRVGERGEGKWEKISWEQALDEIAEKLKAIKRDYGAEAVATTGGTGRGHEQIFKTRFMNLFGSPNNAGAGQWCSVVNRAKCLNCGVCTGLCEKSSSGRRQPNVREANT